MEEFDIYIGGIAEDRAEPPAARFARAFGLPELRAREFVASLPRVVKRSVPADQTHRYAALLRDIGAVFELRRSPIRPVQTIGVAGLPGPSPRDEALDPHGALLALPDLRHSDPRGLRFPATVAGTGGAAPARAEEAIVARPIVAEAPAPLPDWDPTTAPTLRESRPPPPRTQQTLREAAPDELFAVPYAAPQRSVRPRAQPPAASSAPAPLTDDGLPVPPRGGQAPWLALGAEKYEADLEQLTAAASAQPASGDRAAQPGVAKLPARPPGPAPFTVYTAGRVTHSGVPLGRESRPQPPLLLRLAMRAVLGGSLFSMITSVRHCHVFPTDVEVALAEWQPGAPSGAPGVAALGPIALDWMASDLHQVTGGDKDRARGIAERLKKAGAVEVYVGSIMNAGAVQLAGELLVELPPDEDKRRAVLATHAELMRSTFVGAAVAPPDEESSMLRIVL